MRGLAAVIDIHRLVGLVFMIVSFVLAVWAFVRQRQRQPLPPPYWRALRGAAALVALNVLLGLVLLSQGLRPADGLHYMYAGLVVVGVAAAELLRPRASLGRMLREEGHFNEPTSYALLTLVVSLLTLRLWMTGGGQ